MAETILNTKYHTDGDKLIVQRSQDVQKIMDFNKERNIEGHKRNSDMRLVTSIPFVFAEAWSKECGANIGSKELAAHVKTKMLSGEFSKFLANGY